MKRKSIVSLLLAICLAASLLCTACGKAEVKADYEKAEDFEAALNAGEDLNGKTVTFTVTEAVPNSAFGYNLMAGEHLNFCSSQNPNAKAGDTLTVRVTGVTSVLGSWIIGYEKVD